MSLSSIAEYEAVRTL